MLCFVIGVPCAVQCVAIFVWRNQPWRIELPFTSAIDIRPLALGITVALVFRTLMFKYFFAEPVRIEFRTHLSTFFRSVIRRHVAVVSSQPEEQIKHRRPLVWRNGIDLIDQVKICSKLVIQFLGQSLHPIEMSLGLVVSRLSFVSFTFVRSRAAVASFGNALPKTAQTVFGFTNASLYGSAPLFFL